MPASGAVWQLPSTEPVLKQQMKCSLSLPLVPLVVTTPDVPTTPHKHACVTAQCLCVLEPAPELGQSQPITGVSGHLPGALASDQHNLPSHPRTDITTLALQAAQDLNNVLNNVSRNFVHCKPSYG